MKKKAKKKTVPPKGPDAPHCNKRAGKRKTQNFGKTEKKKKKNCATEWIK
jgi:hypothetical protein